MNGKDLFKLEDIEDAYRKFKTYVYYDNSTLFNRKKIAEFESDNFNVKLTRLYSLLNSRYSKSKYNKLFDQINFLVSPKKIKNNIIKNPNESLIVTNRYSSEYYEVEDVNYFVDIPIELHIIAVLWIIKLGYVLDSDYCSYSDKKNSYCYANKLVINEKSKKVEKGNQLFHIYHKQYQKWRDNSINVVEDLLYKKEKDAIIVSLDIKKYYPSAELSFLKLKADIKQKFKNLNSEEEYNNYQFLTTIIKTIHSTYFEKITKAKLDNSAINEVAIPIGILSSNIIANWYLMDFDKKVFEKIKPEYYGRYVDDILIVLENPRECYKERCDRNNCINNRKLSTKTILKRYFCGSIDNKCQGTNKCKKYKNIILDSAVLKESTDEEGEEIFKIIGFKDLRIQPKKVKLFVFDANSSKALLKKFKENIRKHSSEFRFLPEDDRLDRDLIQEAYSIDYSDSINKLRSIEKCSLDKFKVSSYLAKQLILAKYSKNSSQYEKVKEELLYSFNGRLGIELYIYWDKVFTYFVLNYKIDDFITIYKKLLKKINKTIEVQAEKEIIKAPKSLSGQKPKEEKLQMFLKEYLFESALLALSLNSNIIFDFDDENPIKLKGYKNNFDFKIEDDRFDNIEIISNKINDYRNSAMIKHTYMFMPLLNFSNLDSFHIDYTDENILYKILKDTNESKDKIDDDWKFNEDRVKFSPRYFNFEELQVWYIYKDIVKQVNGDAWDYDLYLSTFNEITQKYIDLNIKDKFNSNYTDKITKKLAKYFNSFIVKDKNNNEKQKLVFRINSEHKISTSKVKVGLYNKKISENEIVENLLGKSILSYDKLQKIIKLLNMAVDDKNCNIIVFPEVSIPVQCIDLLANFSKTHNLAIVCGLEHIITKEGRNKKALNLLATFLPFDINNHKSCFIKTRLKKHYAPAERKLLLKNHLQIPDAHKVSNDLFIWNGLYFAGYNCYELTDIDFRAKFKSEVDFLIACEWNQDVKTFASIVESTSKDVHCYVIQVNTSQFGDSKIISPSKSEKMIPLFIKGGEDNILVGSIDIKSLRRFQCQDTDYQDSDEYKPLPPNFKIDNNERLLPNNL